MDGLVVAKISCSRGRVPHKILELDEIDGSDIDGRGCGFTGCFTEKNCTTSLSSFKLTGRSSVTGFVYPWNAGWLNAGIGGTTMDAI